MPCEEVPSTTSLRVTFKPFVAPQDPLIGQSQTEGNILCFLKEERKRWKERFIQIQWMMPGEESLGGERKSFWKLTAAYVFSSELFKRILYAMILAHNYYLGIKMTYDNR